MITELKKLVDIDKVTVENITPEGLKYLQELAKGNKYLAVYKGQSIFSNRMTDINKWIANINREEKLSLFNQAKKLIEAGDTLGDVSKKLGVSVPRLQRLWLMPKEANSYRFSLQGRGFSKEQIAKKMVEYYKQNPIK